MKYFWRLTPFIIFLALVAVMWVGLSHDPRALPSARIGQRLPDLALPLLDNPAETLRLSDIKGRMTLVNVWASWCDACRDEQVFLLQLAGQGVPILGLNYQDNRKNALSWLQKWGNPFYQSGSDPRGLIGIELGVYGTPETFLIDEKGVIRIRFAGLLNQEVWKRAFLPLFTTKNEPRH